MWYAVVKIVACFLVGGGSLQYVGTSDVHMIFSGRRMVFSSFSSFFFVCLVLETICF